MFDLEQSIAAWRASMAASLGNNTDVLDELESHLREQLHRLALEGLTAEGAWDRALERLGPPRRLAAEFGKIESAEPLRWIPAWLSFSLYLCAGIGVFVPALRGGDGLLSLHIIAVTLGYCAVLAYGSLAVWSLGVRAVRGGDDRKTACLLWWAQKYSWAALFFTAIGVVTGAIWAHENWGRSWNWDAREIGGVAVIAWNIAALSQLRRSRRTGTSGFVLGLIGNMVVWCAWFGPHLFGAGLHNYGTSAPFALAFWGAFMGVHAVLLAAVLAKTHFARPAATSR